MQRRSRDVKTPNCMYQSQFIPYPLHWRHNDNSGVSNRQPGGCLLTRLFRRRLKKTSKLRVTGLWWRHNVITPSMSQWDNHKSIVTNPTSLEWTSYQKNFWGWLTHLFLWRNPYANDIRNIERSKSGPKTISCFMKNGELDTWVKRYQITESK